MNFSRHSNEIDSKLIEFRKIKKLMDSRVMIMKFVNLNLYEV